MTAEDQRVLDKQVSDWAKEMQRLAGMIAASKGNICAVVLIQPLNEGYDDVAPELIVEDAFNVQQKGWPSGFQIDVLNPSV